MSIGGAGIDTISYEDNAAAVTVNLAAGVATGGAAAGDVLLGSVNADILDGGEGRDEASYAGSANRVIVDLAAGTVQGGDAQGDTLVSIENVSGSNRNDMLGGNAEANLLNGLAGDDLLSGRGGSDALSGGLGADALFGNAGEDILLGGDGNDYLDGQEDGDFILGGTGNDRLFGGADVITDFLFGTDRINLSGIDANATLAGDQAFAFVGIGNDGGPAGTLRIGFIENVGIFLFGNVDDDPAADLIINIGAFNVQANDFFL